MNYRILLMTLFFAAGIACTNSPHNGAIFTNTANPVHHRPGGLSMGPGNIEKRGESCSYTFALISRLFYYGSGNSIEAAMKAGGITRIGVVEYASTSLLGSVLFSRDCVVVWGD